jgi:hypothetical protein
MTNAFDFAHCHPSLGIPADSCANLVARLGEAKARLQERFTAGKLTRIPLVSQALDEAEALAWYTSFPQLFLPDFAELRLAEMEAAQSGGFTAAA